MADIKVLYVNSDGVRQEHSEGADSIRMLSFKTATKELTDGKLANLIDGADANDEHIHDARYYREDEHIATSAGAGDADKPVITGADGKLDESFIDTAALGALIDHGDLLGLGDDDHTQYILVDGTRAFTGDQSMGGNKLTNVATPTADQDAANKLYVDQLHVGDEWHPDSALDYITDNTLAPPTEVLGDVYVLAHDGGTPNAAWDGASAGDIVKFDGSVWVATTPTTGKKLTVDDETTSVRLWNGTQWQQQFYEATTASTGLTKVGVDIRLADAAAQNGIAVSSGAIAAQVDDATIEINGSEQLAVKADGINDTHIDFGTGANQVSGEDIPLADAGGYFTTDNVEAALQQLAANAASDGVDYTAIGGITKGDLVYISGTDSVSTYSTISSFELVVGVAQETVTNGQTVKVLANDTVIDGVLTGATPGTRYYWNGSGYTTNLGSFSAGNYIWAGGVAKNATDAAVEVTFVKRQAV